MGATEMLLIEEKSGRSGQVDLHLKGALDVDTSPQLKRMLERCFKENPEQILVRMDHLTDIDSSGIATLVEGLRWSRSSGGRFILSGLQDAARDLIIISKLEHEFDIQDSSRE